MSDDGNHNTAVGADMKQKPKLWKRCLVVLASFYYPGLIQFLNGETRKVLICLSTIPIALLAQRTVLNPQIPIVFLFIAYGITLGATLYLILDGLRHTNRKMECYERFPWIRLGIACAVLFSVLGGISVNKHYLTEQYLVPTLAMEPTIFAGDRVLADKRQTNVKLGDLIVFDPPKSKLLFVKRVVGMPGDRVEFRNGDLYLNDQLVTKTENEGSPEINKVIIRRQMKTIYIENLGGVQHYVVWNHEIPQNRNMSPVIVPSNAIFVAGDNRDNSHDSRAWGFVPLQSVKGIVKRVFFSRKGKIRWWRFGLALN